MIDFGLVFKCLGWDNKRRPLGKMELKRIRVIK
jgi:hypothetical protein